MKLEGMGKFFFTILSGFAEMEREMVRERIRLGIKRRISQGFILGKSRSARIKDSGSVGLLQDVYERTNYPISL